MTSRSKKSSRDRVKERSRYLKSKKSVSKRRVSPEKFIEDHLIRLNELSKSAISFWSEYQSYLASEREKRKDAILQSLLASAIDRIELDNLRRLPKNFKSSKCQITIYFLLRNIL